jgi:hypothetical protein
LNRGWQRFVGCPEAGVKRSVSQIPGATSAIRREGFFRKCIELSGARILLNGSVEPVSVERFKARAQTG